MSIQTFKRYEDKFIVNNEQFLFLRSKLNDFMELDSYCKDGSYKILNIYFDSPDGEVIRRSTEKPYFKEKLRLRSYGVPASSQSTVYLELKRKSGGIVAKRRAALTCEQAEEYIKNGTKPENMSYITNQVLTETDYFLSDTGAVPAYFLSYDRIAMFGKKDGSFRLTLDNNIQSRRKDLSFKSGCYGRQLLEEGTWLMEIKFLGAIPIEFTHLLSQLKIYHHSFSKIGTEYIAGLKLKNEKSPAAK